MMMEDVKPEKVEQEERTNEYFPLGTCPQQKEQHHKQGSVRHLEKRRNGTCLFANRVANVSLDAYRRLLQRNNSDGNNSNNPVTTCVASIVAHDSQDDTLKVVSLGVGTKFCTSPYFSHAQNGKSSNDDEISGKNDKDGYRIRDGHAEVLAKRAFQKQLLCDMASTMQSNNNSCSSAELLEFDNGTERGVWKLRSNITLHMYCSSAPCGNATLKRFAKVQKEKFQNDLPDNQWPSQQLPHSPMQNHSIPLGQFTLLLKKNSDIIPINDARENVIPNQTKKQKSWPCFTNEDWCPPGTSVKYGTSHTCSDKIGRWNIMGLQGSLLCSLLNKPIYLTTITVGRKYNFEMCRRAVCCRFSPPPPKKKKHHSHPKKRKSDSIVTTDDHGISHKTKHKLQLPKVKNSSIFLLNHPILMETNVYMNPDDVLNMSGCKPVGSDVRFDDSSCFAWWISLSSTSSPCNSTEHINGTTGFLHKNYNHHHNDCNSNQEPLLSSQLCTASITNAFLDIISNRDNLSNGNDDVYKCFISMVQYIKMKRIMSPHFETFKDELFVQHPTFRHWQRRRYTILPPN